MNIAISQPAYLPWQGYIALIDYVDEFIFLENVQFTKRTWDQRNKIVFNDKIKYLTIPVKSKGKYNQKIYEVELNDFNKIKQNHLLSIKHVYSKCEYFKDYFYEFEKIYTKEFIKLSDLNKNLIKHFCNVLKIDTTLSDDKTYSFTSKKLNYLKDICIDKKCDNYISTLGSKTYIKDLKYFPNTNIKISYYDFKDSVYNQKNTKFIPRLSILDLLFNLGPKSKEYLRNNFILYE